MKYKLLMSSIVLLLSLFTLTACHDSDSKEVPLTFENIKWELKAYGYEETLQDVLNETFVTVFFDEENATVSGSGGCNNYTADYTIEADKLSVSAFSSTEMYCQFEGIMQQEEAFFMLLSEAVNYHYPDERLQIKSEDDQMLILEKIIEIEVDIEDNGTQVSLEKGDFLLVSLSSNSSTGYQWEVADINTSVLQQVQVGESTYVLPESPLIGASGIEVFRFRAVDSGTSSLKLIYKQPWSTEVARTYVLEVLIES